MSLHNNPNLIRFNPNTQYNVIPTGGVSVIPYNRDKVNDNAAADSKDYGNKFFNEQVYRDGEPPIRLTPDMLEDIRIQSIRKKQFVGTVYTQTFFHYINVDSSQRKILPVNNYDEELITLPPYPIKFTNGSSIITVSIPNNRYVVDDNIVLSNIISKNLMLRNVLTVKKNSLFMRITQNGHGMTLYGLFNPTNSEEFQPVYYVDYLPKTFNPDENIPDLTTQYYILKKNATIDLTIQISNINGSDVTRTFIGNIPTNYINKKQTVYLLFTKNNNVYQSDPNSYLIILEKKSSINYQDGVSDITDINGNPTGIVSNNTAYIKFNNLFGIPLNYLNSGTPISENQKYQYAAVLNSTPNSFTIDVNYNAVIDPSPNYSFYTYTDVVNGEYDVTQLVGCNNGGGGQCFTRRISYIIPGYPNPNNYVFQLDRIYRNVIQAKIISSVFPNSQRIINDNEADIINNRLYWRNLADGNWIYYLTITPGNYSPEHLATSIMDAFNQTIRYQYTTEYTAGIIPPIIKTATPIDNTRYDVNGYYKYHMVDVSISPTTDIVSFTAYRQVLEQDKPNEYQVIVIPDYSIEFTAAENFCIDFGLSGTKIVPQNIVPFNPAGGELLYIYFTPNTHIRVNENFPYANYNLYVYVEPVAPSTTTTNGYNTFTAQLETTRALLVNFYRNRGIYPNLISEQEINSINTPTMLQNFEYNYLTGQVYLPNNQLNIGDLIITDQFVDPATVNQIFVYEITNIIDTERFTVISYAHGEKYKFIYDSIIINFNQTANAPPTEAYYWLDQIIASEPITSLASFPENNNTLSFVSITPTAESKQLMWVRQPNNGLSVGDVITIAGSAAVNQVPPSAINTSHTINKILDDNYYQVFLGSYTPLSLSASTGFNMISITYPDLFQMFFNYQDTLGNILSFNKVGQDVAITGYQHIIKNTDPYPNDYTYASLGRQFEQGLKKLDMTGDNYFYIVCPELCVTVSAYSNTSPVSNVFGKVRWFNDPGNVVFDSFVPNVNIFYDPIDYLNELHISIVKPNGGLVEFNGLNHSFTIELIEVYNQPDETDISARINAETIVRRV